MLSQDELQRRIAEEFLRVGASQQSWDQNFPDQPSVWVPGETGPVLSPESRSGYEDIAYRVTTSTPPPNLNCPAPSVQTYLGGSWVCMLPDGSVVVGEDEWSIGDEEGASAPPVAEPVAASPTEVIAGPFVGGRLGVVRYAPIANRNLNGIRVGILPRVVMGDQAPGSYGTASGWAAAAGSGSENIEP